MRQFSDTIRSYFGMKQGIDYRVAVEVEWTDFTWTTYEDEVLTVLDIQEAITVIDKTFGALSVTIEDNGTIDENVHYHKRPANVYFLVGEEKILLFNGRVTSPFVYENRTVSFEIVNEIETEEIGFSPDEGELDFVPNQFASVIWPLGFGSVEKAPAVKVREPRSMSLVTLLTIPDPLLLQKINIQQFLINNRILEAYFWLQTLATHEDLVGPTFAQDFVDMLNTLRTIWADVNTAQQEMKTAEDALQNTPSQLNQTNYNDAVANFQTVVATAAATASTYPTMVARIDVLYNKLRYRRGAATSLVQTLQDIRDAMSQLHSLVIEYCRQAQSANPNQRVENSDEFPQNEELTIWIKDTKFKCYVDGQDLFITDGPLPTYENLPLDPWAPEDDSPCDADLVSLGLFRCSTNIQGQWALVRDIHNKYHILKIDSQNGNKVYFTPVQWHESRLLQIPKLDIDHVIQSVANFPVVPPLSGWPDPSVFSGQFDPLLWNMKETQRYLFLVNQVPNPTPEEKELLAKIAYMEPFDQLNEAVMTPFMPTPESIYTVIGTNIAEIVQVAGTILPSWPINQVPFEEIPDAITWSAEPGTPVQEEDRCLIYIVNTVPSEIKGVFAYRKNRKGENFLSPIPSSWYTKHESHNLGTMDICALTFPRPVPDFGADVYVTYTSSVGPRIVDILKFIIENYTDKTWDPASFFAVEDLFQDKYPANYVIYSRQDCLQEMHQIAHQSRCRLFLRNGVFHLKYLSLKGVPVKEITNATIVANTDKTSIARTEELVTKYRATWRPDYLPTTKIRETVIRYNIQRYGLHVATQDFHIYNIHDLVQKSATFWAIRKSNTFRRLIVEVTLADLDVEVHDTVLFAGQICTVVGWQLNPDELRLELEFPIRLGETSEYIYYWPSSLPPDVEYPPPEDQFSGRFGRHSGVKGTISCG